MIQSHDKIEILKFGGLYGRDSFDDSVPPDHFIDSLNTITKGNELRTRDGLTKLITLANLRDNRIYKRQGEADRNLVLDSGGNLFDATVSLVTPILTVAGMTGFSSLNYNNNCFISPHN